MRGHPYQTYMTELMDNRTIRSAWKAKNSNDYTVKKKNVYITNSRFDPRQCSFITAPREQSGTLAVLGNLHIIYLRGMDVVWGWASAGDHESTASISFRISSWSWESWIRTWTAMEQKIRHDHKAFRLLTTTINVLVTVSSLPPFLHLRHLLSV